MRSNERANGFALSRDLKSSRVAISELTALGHETRKHPHNQIRKLAKSLDEYGFVLPVLIDSRKRVVAGWGLVLAARKLELSEVPAIELEDLSEARLRSLRLALNRLGEESAWVSDMLKLEFSEIMELDSNLDLSISGFDMGEIDMTLNRSVESDEDVVPSIQEKGEPICKLGDLWGLGEHRVLCGNSLLAANYEVLLADEKAEMIFTDPPYNVPIDGHVSGLGQVKHEDFAMASGEMSSNEFVEFLKTTLGLAAENSEDGSIHFVCMDWRHVKEIITAGEAVYSELKNICVWNKTNGGMGSLYRSKHELVLVYKVGQAPHINNVELGRHGRYRSNVWDYPGANVMGSLRDNRLEDHPTVKPVALIADAILDCSKRGSLVLDPFAGSGSTLMAAVKTGRRAALIEYEPRYVDVILKRWRQQMNEEPELIRRSN